MYGRSGLKWTAGNVPPLFGIALFTPNTAPIIPGKRVVCVENLIRLITLTEIASNSAAAIWHEKKDGAIMNITKPIKLTLCWLAAMAVLVPAMSWAETDCRSTAAEHVSASQQIWPHQQAYQTCAVEIATGVGAIVWEIRRNMDGDVCHEVFNYCYWYSLYCPHYSWQKGCLKQKSPLGRNCFK